MMDDVVLSRPFSLLLPSAGLGLLGDLRVVDPPLVDPDHLRDQGLHLGADRLRDQLLHLVEPLSWLAQARSGRVLAPDPLRGLELLLVADPLADLLLHGDADPLPDAPQSRAPPQRDLVILVDNDLRRDHELHLEADPVADQLLHLEADPLHDAPLRRGAPEQRDLVLLVEPDLPRDQAMHLDGPNLLAAMLSLG